MGDSPEERELRGLDGRSMKRYEHPNTPLDYLANRIKDFTDQQDDAPDGLRMILMMSAPSDDQGRGQATTAFFGYEDSLEAMADLMMHLRAAGKGMGFDVLTAKRPKGDPADN